MNMLLKSTERPEREEPPEVVSAALSGAIGQPSPPQRLPMKRLLLPALLALAALSARAEVADYYPMIVRADREATVTLVFTNEPALAATNVLEVVASCADGEPSNTVVVPAAIDGNILTVTPFFHGETEQTLSVSQKFPGSTKKPKLLGVARLYSLAPDYFALRPYRGNLHMHSKFSDGRKDETPAMMVATCRKLGFDFAVETDHHSYTASVAAVEAFAKLPTDMKTFPGEEVHSPENRVHILSLGASESMTDWFNTRSNEYKAAVAEAKAALPDSMTPIIKTSIAASFVIWDRIRSRGGLAVFCHPYWRPKYRQYIPNAASDYILHSGKFDAMEVLNTDSSDLGILMYNELRAEGLKIPGIGVTDAHAAATLPNAYTLVLAEKPDFPSIAKNIRLRNCAAVDVDTVSGRQNVIGEFRFSRYAIFLIKNYYPRQDAVCKKEGALLLQALARGTNAVAAVAQLKETQGTTPALRVKYWQP